MVAHLFVLKQLEQHIEPFVRRNPSGENEDEPQVDAPWVNVCVIGCRLVPSG